MLARSETRCSAGRMMFWMRERRGEGMSESERGEERREERRASRGRENKKKGQKQRCWSIIVIVAITYKGSLPT